MTPHLRAPCPLRAEGGRMSVLLLNFEPARTAAGTVFISPADATPTLTRRTRKSIESEI
jgi:hypothetical protein